MPPKKISKKPPPPKSLLSSDSEDEDLIGMLNIKPSPVLKVPTPVKQSPQTVKPLSPEIKKKKRRDSTKRTPVASFDELAENKEIDLNTKLANYRYQTFEFIDTPNDKFTACIDPLGNSVIICLDGDGSSIIDDVILKNLKPSDKSNFEEQEVTFLKSKVSKNITGVMVVNNNQYIFLIYGDDGILNESYFSSMEVEAEDEILNYKVFPIIKYSEILEDANFSVKRVREAYNVIRQIDNMLNLSIFKMSEKIIMDNQRIFKTFLISYNKLSKSLSEDIKELEKHASEWYKLYGEQKLTDEDNNNFKSVNLNLFERYKRLSDINKIFKTVNTLMNTQSLVSNKIYDLAKDLDKTYDYLADNVLNEHDISLQL